MNTTLRTQEAMGRLVLAGIVPDMAGSCQDRERRSNWERLQGGKLKGGGGGTPQQGKGLNTHQSHAHWALQATEVLAAKSNNIAIASDKDAFHRVQ